MKDKVLAALGLKYKGKSLSKTFLESIATTIAAGITEETEIEGKITELDPFIVETANEGNRRATDATLKAKAETKPADQNKEADKEEPKADDTPAWAKALLDKVQKLETEKAQTTSKQKFAELMGKDIPATRYSRIALPETDEELTALAEELKAEHAVELQSVANGGLGNDRSANGTGTPAGAEKISPAVAAFISKSAAERKTV